MGVEVKKCIVVTCDKCGRDEVYYSDEELLKSKEIQEFVIDGTKLYLCNDCTDKLHFMIKKFILGKDEYMEKLKLEKDNSYKAGFGDGKLAGREEVYFYLKEKYDVSFMESNDKLSIHVNKFWHDEVEALFPTRRDGMYMIDIKKRPNKD